MKKILLLLLVSSFCFSVGVFATEKAAAEKQVTADTVGINGKIYSVNEKQPWAT